MLFDKIKADINLSPFLKNSCREKGISISIDKTISSENYIIIKVDDYYNNLKIDSTPPSIDCMIIQKCIKSGYGLTLIELKSMSNSKHFDLKNLIEKFNTCLEDFIPIRFKHYFLLDYKKVNLYLISNINIYKNDLGLKLEVFINKPFYYKGRKYLIEPKMPTPLLKNCYSK